MSQPDVQRTIDAQETRERVARILSQHVTLAAAWLDSTPQAIVRKLANEFGVELAALTPQRPYRGAY